MGIELHVFMVCNNPEIMEYRTQLFNIIYKRTLLYSYSFHSWRNYKKKTNLATFYRYRGKCFSILRNIFVYKAYKLIVKYKIDNNRKQYKAFFMINWHWSWMYCTYCVWTSWWAWLISMHPSKMNTPNVM